MRGSWPNQSVGAARTDEEWSTALETAQTATRRDDLKHGTNAAYAAGCVCAECREHQRERMAIGSQKPQTGASSGGASGASTRARTTVDTADVYGNMPSIAASKTDSSSSWPR